MDQPEIIKHNRTVLTPVYFL